MKLITTTITLTITLFLQAKAQHIKSYFNTDGYSHTVNYDHYKAVFHVQDPEKSSGNIKSDRKYAWFSGNQIRWTQGGYSGKLLHGTYNEIYDSRNLKTQGVFKMGLQSGPWKSWGEDGVLDSIVNYSSGIANGRFEKYSPSGNLAEKGSYHDGQLNGKLKRYISPDSIQVIRYKMGKIVPQSPAKAGKIMRWLKSFYKKKNKKPKTN